MTLVILPRTVEPGVGTTNRAAEPDCTVNDDPLAFDWPTSDDSICDPLSYVPLPAFGLGALEGRLSGCPGSSIVSAVTIAGLFSDVEILHRREDPKESNFACRSTLKWRATR